ncbi:hypothetical protein [Delftia acidovorans]
MTEQACQFLAISIATTRLGLLSTGSYVAPSPQHRIPCKRHKTELTYCPIYGFKPPVFCTKGLTLAIFYGCNCLLRQHRLQLHYHHCVVLQRQQSLEQLTGPLAKTLPCQESAPQAKMPLRSTSDLMQIGPRRAASAIIIHTASKRHHA